MNLLDDLFGDPIKQIEDLEKSMWVPKKPEKTEEEEDDE